MVRRAALAKPFVRVAAGEDHTLALTSGGAVLSTGNNAFGQLGKSEAMESNLVSSSARFLFMI